MATITKASAGSKTSTTKTAKTAATATAKPKAAAKPKATKAGTTVKKAPAKAAAPKATKTAAPKATKTAAPKKSVTEVKAVRVAADRRRDYVEVAAYYIAERRNFVGGNAADDWKAAEAEIDRLLAAGKLTG